MRNKKLSLFLMKFFSIYIIFSILLSSSLCFADISEPLNLQEEDGSPSVYPYSVKVANGTLTDNGDGTASLSGGAPTNADYLVGTANGSLSAEIVVGTAPGGSLGGTWASPTIDDLFLLNTGDVGTGAYDFGGAVLELPNGTSGTTDATGETFLDTDGDGGTNFSGEVFQVYNGSANKYLFLMALPLAASQDNYVPKYDATAKTVQWETDSLGSGDITTVGDVTSGAAFDGTAGSNLILLKETAGTIEVANSTTADTVGADFFIDGANGFGTAVGGPIFIEAGYGGLTSGRGGNLQLKAGSGRADGAGGSALLQGGNGTGSERAGGDVTLQGGNGLTADSNGGNIYITRGTGAGAGSPGTISLTGATTVTGNISATNLSGTNTGDQTITLTGDVTGTGTGSFATTIAANSVALTDDTTGNYLASISEGNYLDVTGVAGEGWTATVAFDPTELGTVTWYNGAVATDIIWTFDGETNDGTFGFYEDEDAFSFTNANVGIGTTGPTALLHLYGALATPTTFTGTDKGQLHIADTVSSADRISKITFTNPYANGIANAAIASQFKSTGSFLLFGTSNNYDNGVTNTAMAIDPTGNVGIGTTGPGALLHVSGSTGSSEIRLTKATGDGTAGVLSVYKARGNVGSPAVLSNNDDVLSLTGYGYSGAASNYLNNAQIQFAIDGNPDTASDTTDMPGRIEFYTVPDGSATLAERMRIQNDGNVGIGTTNPTHNLTVANGSTSAGFIAINEDTDNGTNNATFTVPALTADTDYILPADDGDAGEQLQTDGTGTLTWEAASTASGWTDNGSTLSTTTDGDSVIIGGATAVGTSGTSVLMIENGTAPSSSPTDAVQLYSKDGAGTAGSGAVLVANFNGADAATSYTAEVGGAFTFVNNAQLDTAQSALSSASSLLLDGTNDSVTLADSTDWDLDAGSSTSYTIDLWARFAATTTRIALINQRETDSLHWSLLIANGPTLNFRVNATSAESNVITLSANTWYHIEIDMSGTTCYFFQDGTAKNNAASAATGDYSATLTIGESAQADVPQNDFNGWIDGVRIRRGTAEHTSGFTAPTAEWTGTGTAELTVRDEAGNVTTLSPHNISGLPAERVEEIIKAGHIPTTFHHTDDLGNEEWIDTVGIAMEVEKLTGKRMIFSKTKTSSSLVDSQDPIFKEKMLEAITQNWEEEVAGLDEREVSRRAGWIREKAARELAFQNKRALEGKPLKESEKPPLWLQDVVDILKD